jgi:glycosyltransferase involved in cell wall biosynthesis
VERHVDDLVGLLADDCEVLRLRPDGDDAVELAWLREGEEMQAWFGAADWPACIALLQSLGIARVHFHHVHGLPRAALDLPGDLDVPYDATLHDYYPICPRYHLAPGAGRHCGEESGARCERCLEAAPAQWGLALDEWRALFHGFLRAAARVIVPSQDAAARLRRYFPDVALLVWSHPETPRTAQAVYKVALLGGLSAIKGARVLEACVRDAVARGLPLHYHVVGHVDRPMDTWPRAPLTLTGSYEEKKLPELLAIERPDAILFLSQVPETYSYTLSAAMDSGLPVVAPRLGAFPERLRGYRAHALFPHDASAEAINDALLLRLGSGASGKPAAAAG